MKNWKAILGALLVFLLGGLAGSFTTLGVIRHRLAQGHPGGLISNLVVRRLSWRLRLDRTQREQLRVIVHDGQKEFRELRRQVQPQIDDILSRSEARVRTILQPGQQEEFDKLIAERKARQAQSKDG